MTTASGFRASTSGDRQPRFSVSIAGGVLTCGGQGFDLASGGAFDLFADDVMAYPVTVEGEDVLVETEGVKALSAHS